MASATAIVSRPIAVRLLNKLNKEAIERQLRSQQETEDRAQHPQRHLYCVHCARAITREDQRIPMQGGHQHVFSNPHGFTFHIGCFAKAAGCGPVGPSTLEWSWFQGYRWQVALCLGCGVHLGWRYQGHDGDTFYGLILKRLVSEAERH